MFSLSRTSEDVLNILGQHLEDFKVLQSPEQRTIQLQESTRDQTRILHDKRNSETEMSYELDFQARPRSEALF